MVSLTVLCDIDCKSCVLRHRSRLFPRGDLFKQLKNGRFWNKKKLLAANNFYSHCQTVEKIDCFHFFSGLCQTCGHALMCLEEDKHDSVAIWPIALAKIGSRCQKRIRIIRSRLSPAGVSQVGSRMIWSQPLICCVCFVLLLLFSLQSNRGRTTADDVFTL